MSTTTTKIDSQVYTYLSEDRSPTGQLMAEARWTITVDKPTAKILEVVFYDGHTSAVVPVAQHSEEISTMLEMDGLQCDIQGRVFNKAERDYVMSRMHYGSPDYIGHSNQDAWLACYLLGDGFGEITLEEAQAQSFDWSHVRDSSPYAIAQMATRLTDAEIKA